MRIYTKIRLTMLCLSGFELYSRWEPLNIIVKAILTKKGLKKPIKT